MQAPIWWIRWSTALDIWWSGNDYYAQPRFDWVGSWLIAWVIADTCRSIREGRRSTTRNGDDSCRAISANKNT